MLKSFQKYQVLANFLSVLLVFKIRQNQSNFFDIFYQVKTKKPFFKKVR